MATIAPSEAKKSDESLAGDDKPPATPDPHQAYINKLAQDASQSMTDYGTLSSNLITKQKENIEARDKILTPAMEQLKTAAQAKRPDIPTLKPPPDVPTEQVKPRAFLEAPDLTGKKLISPEGSNALRTIIAGIGSIVTSLAGMSAPIGALNALTGAMEGWAEGDARRVASNWQKYEAEVSKLQHQNDQALQLYELQIARWGGDQEAAKANYQVALLEAQKPEYAMQVDKLGMDQAAQKFSMANQTLQQLTDQTYKIMRLQIDALSKERTLAHEHRMEDLTAGKLKETERHNKVEEAIKRSSSVVLDEPTLRDMAEQYLAGDNSVKQGIGRGVQGPQNIVNLNKMIYTVAREQGMNPSDIAAANAEFQGFKSSMRTLGTRAANMGMAVNEFKQFADLALDASKAVPRTNFIPLNKLIQMVQAGTATPEQGAFATANLSAINAYSAVVTRSGGTTVHSQEEAAKMLFTADNQEDYAARIAQLKKEADAASKSPAMTREELHKTFRGGKGGETGPALPKGIPAGSKQIGTSGGKPVYQAPDGKRYIAE